MRADVLLLTAVALATAVEMVEALTIVLAVGVTRGWRATLLGAGAALLSLGLVILALGPAITRLPLSTLRVAIGGLLLIFGVQWLRKAILRSSGYKALHDEDEIYSQELAAARDAGRPSGFDGYSFAISYKGVFLEGLEVVFIVLTFGAQRGLIGPSALTAVVTAIAVGMVGVVVRGPLSRVPENTLKFAVGLLLSTFGLFWSSEGAGVRWPGDDLSILVLLAVLAGVSFAFVRLLRRRRNLELEMAS